MKTLLKHLILPPASLFALGLLGILCLRRRPRLGRTFLWVAAISGYLLSTPAVSFLLRSSLEVLPLSLERGTQRAAAIVVLGGDVNTHAPEYGGETLGGLTLERVRYGAHLARATGLPVLTTGGTARNAKTSVGALMKEVLESEFGVKVRWAETEAPDTEHNARYAQRILAAAGIQRVLLVTHSWHMPRSLVAFESAGLEAVPAPTDYRAAPSWQPSQILPSAGALLESSLALHEWLGRLWYRLRGMKRSG